LWWADTAGIVEHAVVDELGPDRVVAAQLLVVRRELGFIGP
jgi:hypothetical protein